MTRRRWSFTLRTLFVRVTVMACWLGWAANRVRQRRMVIADLESRGSVVELLYDADRQCDPMHNGGYGPEVSLIRSLLGDCAIANIDTTAGSEPSRDDRALAEKWFPEAAFIFGRPHDASSPSPKYLLGGTMEK